MKSLAGLVSLVLVLLLAIGVCVYVLRDLDEHEPAAAATPAPDVSPPSVPAQSRTLLPDAGLGTQPTRAPSPALAQALDVEEERRVHERCRALVDPALEGIGTPDLWLEKAVLAGQPLAQVAMASRRFLDAARLPEGSPDAAAVIEDARHLVVEALASRDPGGRHGAGCQGGGNKPAHRRRRLAGAGPRCAGGRPVRSPISGTSWSLRPFSTPCRAFSASFM